MKDKPTSTVNEKLAARSRWYTGGTVFVLAMLAVSIFGWQSFPGIGQPASGNYPAHEILDRKFARVTFSAMVDGLPVTGSVTKTCNLEIDETSIKLTGGPKWRAASTGLTVALPGGEAILVEIPYSLVCLSDGKSEIRIHDHGFRWVMIVDNPEMPNSLELYRFKSGYADSATGEARPGLLPVGSRIEASSILISSEPAAGNDAQQSGSDEAVEWFTRQGQRGPRGTSRLIGFRAWFVDKAEWSQYPSIVSQVESREDPIWLDRTVLPNIPRVGGRLGIPTIERFRRYLGTYMRPSFWAPLIHLGDNVWQVQDKKREFDLIYRFDSWPPPRPKGTPDKPLLFGISVSLDGPALRPPRREREGVRPTKQFSQITLFDPKSQRLILIVAGAYLRSTQ